MSVAASYCLLHRVCLPGRYPIQPRPEMATRRPSVVATRGAESLLCGCEHDGPHLWPDGDEAGSPGDGPEVEMFDAPIVDAPEAGSVAAESFDGSVFDERVEDDPDAANDDDLT